MDDAKRLFLDDERNPIDVLNYINDKTYTLDWIVIRTFAEFKTFIEENGLPDLISFDHDLGDINNGVEYTGYDAAKWLVEYCMNHSLLIPRYLIHTGNTVGKVNIDSYIKSYLRSIW